jgi:hypothetical protein
MFPRSRRILSLLQRRDTSIDSNLTSNPVCCYCLEGTRRWTSLLPSLGYEMDETISIGSAVVFPRVRNKTWILRIINYLSGFRNWAFDHYSQHYIHNISIFITWAGRTRLLYQIFRNQGSWSVVFSGLLKAKKKKPLLTPEHTIHDWIPVRVKIWREWRARRKKYAVLLYILHGPRNGMFITIQSIGLTSILLSHSDKERPAPKVLIRSIHRLKWWSHNR